MKVVAYLRKPAGKEDTLNRNLEILNFVRKHNITLDEIVEVDMSGQGEAMKRQAAGVMDLLEQGDMLIVQTG